MRSTVALFLIGVGCANAPAEIPDEDFAYWGARALCDRTRECARGDFESAYFSMGDCRAHIELLLQQQYDLFDQLDCDYRAKKAGDAVQDLMDMTCEEFYEGEYIESTNDIWDDCIGYTPFPTTTYGTYQ